MLSVLLTRRWLGALLIATAFAVAAFFLGQWQWGRYETKQARADRIHAHYHAPPQPLTQVLGTAPLPVSKDWTTVQASGRYAAVPPLLVRNRPWKGNYGYEVLAPFRLAGGSEVLVDRGWVPNSTTSANTRPDNVPPTPSGEVTITGWARPGEPSLHRDMPPGQLASVNLDEASADLGTPLLGGYVILNTETLADGTAPPRPRALETPSTDLGPHRAYAFQWWGSMAVGFVLVWRGVRREAEESDTGPDRPAKPKKVRIWDEEDA